MTTAPLLLSFCGETKTGDYEVDSMVMGYDLKNPAIKSALKKNRGNVGILNAFLSKQRTLDLIGKRKKNLYYGYTDDEWKSLTTQAQTSIWKTAQGGLEPIRTTYLNFKKWTNDKALFTFPKPGEANYSDHIHYVRAFLNENPLVHAYFFPDYPDLSKATDDVLGPRIAKDELLLWMTASKYNLWHTPSKTILQKATGAVSKVIEYANPWESVAIKVTGGQSLSEAIKSEKVPVLTDIGVAASIAAIFAPSSLTKTIAQKVQSTAIQQAVSSENNLTATTQAVVNASQIASAKPLSKWRIFLKTYFGL